MSTYAKVCHAMEGMPPRRHAIPGEEYDARKCEVVQWAIEQEPVAQWLFEMLKERGLIRYCAESGQWSGAPVKDTLQKPLRSRTARKKDSPTKKRRGSRGRARSWDHAQVLATIDDCASPCTFETWLAHAHRTIGIGRTAFARYLRELIATGELVKVGKAYAKKVNPPEVGEEIPL